LKIIDLNAIVMLFKEEEEATTIILKRMGWIINLEYTSVMAWITFLTPLRAVGLTAAFSESLSQETSVAM
jgi:hypothetical protein